MPFYYMGKNIDGNKPLKHHTLSMNFKIQVLEF